MPGLSSLKVNIKDQPHNLAWINEEEQALLKDLGGSGRPGPMGIPAYYDGDQGGDPADYNESDSFSDNDKGNSEGTDWGVPSDQLNSYSFSTANERGYDGPPSYSNPGPDQDLNDGMFYNDPDPNTATWSPSSGFSFPTDSLGNITEAGLESAKAIGIDAMDDLYANAEAYGLGYNDFSNMDFFEKSEARDLASMREDAFNIQKEQQKTNPNVTVGVQPDGTYAYGGPLGEAISAMTNEIYKSAKEANKYGAFSALVGSPLSAAYTIGSKLAEELGLDLNPFSESTKEMTKEERQAEIAEEDKSLSKAEREAKEDDIAFDKAVSDFMEKNAGQSLDRTAADATDKEIGMDYATAMAEESYSPLSEERGQDFKYPLYPTSNYLPKSIYEGDTEKKSSSSMSAFFNALARPFSSEDGPIVDYLESAISGVNPKEIPDPNIQSVENIYGRAEGGVVQPPSIGPTSEQMFRDIYGLTDEEVGEKFAPSISPLKDVAVTAAPEEKPKLTKEDFGYYIYNPEELGKPDPSLDKYYEEGDDSVFTDRIRYEGYTDHDWGDTWGAPEWEPEPGMPWTLKMIENHPYVGESGNLAYGHKTRLGSTDDDDEPYEVSFREAPTFRRNDPSSDFRQFKNPGAIQATYRKDSASTPPRDAVKNYFLNLVDTPIDNANQSPSQYEDRSIYQDMIDKYSFKSPELTLGGGYDTGTDSLFIENTGKEDLFSKAARKNREAALNIPTSGLFSDSDTSADYLSKIYGITKEQAEENLALA